VWYNEKKRRNGEVDMIIYFSKINLESTELLEMYKKEEMFDTMRKCILSFLENLFKVKLRPLMKRGEE